ncbi:MAG: hypothetical protein D8B48_05055 [Granulicatella sp.]|nr:MAG: hypothetical protein D8B48_05055 [Granulicatella sp.]
MNQQDYYRNELQMNYFSEEYRRFEEDFYRYSSLTIPLTFLIDDVLLSMAKSNRPYFKLNGKNALDHQDHYFLFTIEEEATQPSIRLYRYHCVTHSLEQLKTQYLLQQQNQLSPH